MALHEWLSDAVPADPVLIMGMEGWIDAGGGGGAAVAWLLSNLSTEPVARFSSDDLIDNRARRPIVRIVDGINTGLSWPTIELRSGVDRSGRGIVLLVGPEPDMRWNAFVGELVALSQQMGVRMAVGLGAFPAPVPHTRPVRLASTATSEELASSVGFVRGTIDVPAGIHAALERGLADAGIPAVGLWARVPHYASAMPYPAATLALLDGLAAITGLAIDASDVREDADNAVKRVDDLISASDEHRAMVRQLELQVDASEGETLFEDGRLPSGEEIAAELQRFLRGNPA